MPYRSLRPRRCNVWPTRATHLLGGRPRRPRRRSRRRSRRRLPNPADPSPLRRPRRRPGPAPYSRPPSRLGRCPSGRLRRQHHRPRQRRPAPHRLQILRRSSRLRPATRPRPTQPPTPCRPQTRRGVRSSGSPTSRRGPMHPCSARAGSSAASGRPWGRGQPRWSMGRPPDRRCPSRSRTAPHQPRHPQPQRRLRQPAATPSLRLGRCRRGWRAWRPRRRVLRRRRGCHRTGRPPTGRCPTERPETDRCPAVHGRGGRQRERAGGSRTHRSWRRRRRSCGCRPTVPLWPP